MDSKYKEKVSDEVLISLVEMGARNSLTDALSGGSLTADRTKATYEYGMLPMGHLAPQGVSQIVSSDTVEIVEGYAAIISELMLNNNKLCRFTPPGKSPKDFSDARKAADLVNYTVFKQNEGWKLLNTWIKSALLWKNSVIRWDFVEDYEVSFEEFETIGQDQLDLMLSEDGVEIVGHLETEQELVPNEETGQADYVIVYKNVRLKRKHNKTRVVIRNVHPEAFRITNDGDSLEEASFVGIQVEMTRSEIRKEMPDAAEGIDWEQVGDGDPEWSTFSAEEDARRRLSGNILIGSNADRTDTTEANQLVNVTECWLRVDRDGDGIAELKHLITAGKNILLEEDVESIPLAVICPFEIPHEFMGLSGADMVRPTTMASTAILRGFIENVYLTNYSPKLADPNVVDFSALQNMKPKQIIPTNGNPQTAVAALSPDTISQGTVPLLEMLQMHKEQATGLGKAAQGLNDTLYVSGNSEDKMQRAQSAAQVRVQFIARRFAETGFKRLAEGVYKLIRTKMRGKVVNYYDQNSLFKSVDPQTLPDNMMLIIDADVGENSNTSMIKKMQLVGSQLLPALREAGAGGAVNPEAAVRIACKTFEALDLDPLDYLVDYTDPEFQKKAEESRKAEAIAEEKKRKLEEQVKSIAIAQAQATLDLTNTQSKNAMQDNVKQLTIALDKSQQEWAKLEVSAAKEGTALNPRQSFQDLFLIAQKAIAEWELAPTKPPAEAEEMPGPAAAPEQPM